MRMGAWLDVPAQCSAWSCSWLGKLLGTLSCFGQQHPCPAHGIMLLHSKQAWALHQTGALGLLPALRFTHGDLEALLRRCDRCKATWAASGTQACSWAWGRGAETPQILAPTLNLG